VITLILEPAKQKLPHHWGSFPLSARTGSL
jgi:hypothetical protein